MRYQKIRFYPQETAGCESPGSPWLARADPFGGGLASTVAEFRLQLSQQLERL